MLVDTYIEPAKTGKKRQNQVKRLLAIRKRLDSGLQCKQKKLRQLMRTYTAKSLLIEVSHVFAMIGQI